MNKFTSHSGIATPMLGDNIDTDQIIPSREMKRVSKVGLADGLFSGQRYLYEGNQKIGANPDFILNQAPYENTSILLSGKNFGCGSSREHAVWALAEYGFKAIIAQSYGEIFFNNALRNGLLPIVLGEAEIAQLAASSSDLTTVTINLRELTVSGNGGSPISFQLETYYQEMLLNGWDFIDLALQFTDQLDDFAKQDRKKRPWAYLSATD